MLVVEDTYAFLLPVCNADAVMHFLLVWLLMEFVAEFCNVDALYISAILSISVYCALMLFDANAGGIFCLVWSLLFCMVMLLIWYLMAVVLYEKWQLVSG